MASAHGQADEWRRWPCPIGLVGICQSGSSTSTWSHSTRGRPAGIAADRQQRFFDVRGVGDAAALQGADLVYLADLTVQVVQRAGAFLHQPVDALQQAGAFAVLIA